MKKVVFGVLALAVSVFSAFSQKQEICIPWSKTVVPIYADKLTDSIIYTIYQDYDMEDHLYEVFIVEKSPLRFKVEFRDMYGHPDRITTGWVDKKYCGVYDRWHYNENNQEYIKLFSSPDSKSEYLKIYKSPARALTVIDFQDNFIEVMFEIEGIIYTGWVDRYCCNILNNCT